MSKDGILAILFMVAMGWAFYASYIWWNVGAVGSLLRFEMLAPIMGPVTAIMAVIFWVKRKEMFKK